MSEPTLQTIITGIITFALGGGVIAYLKFFRDNKTSDRSFAEEERLKLLGQVEILNAAVSSLSARLVPTNFPLWIKDSDRRYIDVNPAWELQIGGRMGVFKAEAIGKTDAEIYSNFPELAAILNDLDEEASSSGGIAVRKNVVFPKDPEKKIVIKEVLIFDVIGKPIYKSIAVPDRPEVL